MCRFESGPNLMNAGGTFALLAFIGKLTETHPKKIPLFCDSLSMFVLGVLLIGFASGSTYLSQWFYAAAEPWKQNVGFALNIMSILLGLPHTERSLGEYSWRIEYSKALHNNRMNSRHKSAAVVMRGVQFEAP